MMFVHLLVDCEDLERYKMGYTIVAVKPEYSHVLSGHHNLEVMVKVNEIIGFEVKTIGKEFPTSFKLYRINMNGEE